MLNKNAKIPTFFTFNRTFIAEGLPRTSNSVEGWHLAFSHIVSHHPHLLKLIDAIKLEQSHTENSCTQLSIVLVRKRSTRWTNYEERVVNLLDDYKKDQMKAWLDNMTLLIQFP